MNDFFLVGIKSPLHDPCDQIGRLCGLCRRPSSPPGDGVSCHKLREVLSSTPPLPDLRLPTDVLAPPSDGFYRHQILGILQLLLMMGPSIDMKMHLPFEWIGTGTAEAARTVESGSDPVHRSSDLNPPPSYPGPIDPSVLYDQKLHISSAIWEGQDRGPLRCHEHTSKIDGWKLLKKQIDKLLTEEDPCAGVKSVVKKRLPKRVRQIREYYFLPWRSLPSTGRALPVELVPGCCWRSG
ncbi:hypothetical protein LWI29_007073 [Acer saccharum]|uniref:Uncharacterized protein n=1 Tax=Acer saccharum TaxID=4024 RepID=A0AA39SR73_ACESA|nr:hypothetical protein LWI29_007073 [Acer saccharum]